MAPPPSEYELSVEQELPAAADGAPRRARLSVRWSSAPGTPEPENELASRLRDLTDRLARAAETAGVGRGPAGERGPDRSVSELLETYRPKQIELVELLHADGELSDGEYDLLRAHVIARPSEGVPPAPVSAPPAGAPRPGSRSVEELLRTYQITSLRQAGAVRARRQISFEEYMALKRHFAAAEASSGAPASSG